MSKSSTFKRSPEDESTYAKWRRGVFIFYMCVGLVTASVIVVAQFSRFAFRLAGN
jgi:hypothetical protein